MTSAALAVCTPHFQWYAILLVMLVALDGQPEWLAIAAGGYLANSPRLHIHGIPLHDPRLLGYGGGAAVACALALARYLITRLARTQAESVEPAAVAGATASAAPPWDSAAEPVLEPTAILEPTAVFARPAGSPEETPADASVR